MCFGLPSGRLRAVRRRFAESHDEPFLARPAGKEKDRVLLFWLRALVVLAGAASRWEAHRSDEGNSSPWERRQRWLAFHSPWRKQQEWLCMLLAGEDISSR